MSVLTDFSGGERDVVITSRVRLARNLAGEPFITMASDDQALAVYEQVKAATADWDSPLHALAMKDLSKMQRQSLMERHLISTELMNSDYGGVLINDTENVAIMVNEEDHIRIQSIKPGYQLQEAYDVANVVDDALEQRLDFAFDEQWGYLTCCPTNVGTGMRASAMLHLPALTITRQIGTVLATIGKVGLTIRGTYGEGTEALGCIYQVSNQITLGASEADLLRRVSTAVESIIRNERFARQYLLEQRRDDLTDKLWRSYGILTYARKLNSQEFMGYWSDAMLGVSMGVITGTKPIQLLQALEECQPATLSVSKGNEMDVAQQDKDRAERVRALFTKEA